MLFGSVTGPGVGQVSRNAADDEPPPKDRLGRGGNVLPKRLQILAAEELGAEQDEDRDQREPAQDGPRRGHVLAGRQGARLRRESGGEYVPSGFQIAAVESST